MPRASVKKTVSANDLNAPKVYSYTRFSTPEQRTGDSNRRQDDQAKSWATRNGYDFDESLRDEGLSGYHGAHRKKGALGSFLMRVQSGDVPRNSILVVENIDRLSREGVVATLQSIIFKLWDHGISLVTLSPEETYEPGCGNETKFFALLMYMQRAWDESKRKSERIRAARNRGREMARENGRVLTSMCPAWLKPKKDRSGFEIDERAAQTIGMIYQWALDGISSRKMEARLNVEAPWTPPPREKMKRERGERGSGWRTSYIRKILHNPAVIGDYQPYELRDGRGGPRRPIGDLIPGYYPAIIAPDLYHAVQAKLAANTSYNERTGKRGTALGGRTGKVANVLTRMARCAYCGGPMRYVNKGKPPKGAAYLICDKGVRSAGCKASHRVRYDETVSVLIDNCQSLRPEDVLPRPKEQAQLCQSLRTRVAGRTAELAEIERRLTNLTNQIGDAPSKAIAARVYAAMENLEASKKVLDEERRDAERQLRNAETSLRSLREWKHGLDELKKALAHDEPEMRLRLRSHLQDLISKIEVFAVGYPTAHDPDSPEPTSRGRNWFQPLDTSEWIAEKVYSLADEFGSGVHRQPVEFFAFVRDLEARRMSKEGRFLRVHYKTGAVVDLVPPGSLASGWGRINGAWQTVEPDLGKLRAEYDRDHPSIGMPKRAKVGRVKSALT